MGSAIKFAVRDVAGGHQVGTVAGEGQGNFIQVGAGDSISLNISAQSVVGYEQQGRDLIIKLADGRTIILAGYFDPEGGAGHLYLSTDGTITEVFLLNDGSGVLTASFGQPQEWGKWSALDDLRFADADMIADTTLLGDDPAGMGIFTPALLGGLGASGAAGVGLLGLGLMGGGGSGAGAAAAGPVSVTLTSGTAATGSVENLEDWLDGVTLAGRGTPGATVVVEIEGKTQTAIIEDDGAWRVTFPADTVVPGEREADVTVTATDTAGHTATVTDRIVLDTLAHPIAIGAVTGDDIIALAEQAGGFVLIGTTAPGASVTLGLAGVNHQATADAQGTWVVSFGPGELATGTYTATITARTVDAAGNISATSREFLVDTEVTPLQRTSLGAGPDAVINGAEATAGITIVGRVEAGSSVMVQFGGGQLRPAAVTADGEWSIGIAPDEIAPGESLSSLSITATDSHGNIRQISETVRIDRIVRDLRSEAALLAGDGIVNAAEAAQGLVVSGFAEAGATVSVAVSGGATQRVISDSSGRWSTVFEARDLPSGEVASMVTVTAVDLAGNTAAYTQSLMIDTVAPGAPDVLQFQRNAQGLTRIVTDEISDRYVFERIDPDGATTAIDAVRSIDEVFGTQNVSFGKFQSGNFVSTPVPDGSYLVVNSVDTAGNESSTLLVVNNTNAPDVDLTRAGLSGFDFAAIDLSFAPDAELTITEAQILALTGEDRSLIVKGGADDRITLADATTTGAQATIDGQDYTIFTLGPSGATAILDDDITVI